MTDHPSAVQFGQFLPMKAVVGELPADEASWQFEIKFDGMRVVAFCEDSRIRLQTANRKDTTITFPELHGLAREFDGRRAVLDGEVVALDNQGAPDFGRLQRRMHVSDPGEVRMRATTSPIVYEIFDLLHFDGNDTLDLEIQKRRGLLENLLSNSIGWRMPTASYSNGPGLLRAAKDRGLEGLVAKKLGSEYLPGKRSPAWRKIKVRHHQEFIVGGWMPGAGGRVGSLGSLLVGTLEDGRLEYAGKVGTGFTQPELRRLGGRLDDLNQDESPFDPASPPEAGLAHWVRPEIVVEVAYAEWTSDRRLRHASYLGERVDKDPREVSRGTG